MSDRASYSRILRLVALWLVTAMIVYGCTMKPNRPATPAAPATGIDAKDSTKNPANGKPGVVAKSPAEPVKEALVITKWPFSLAMTIALCIASWLDPRRRGTWLGVIFGMLAEIVVIHRVPDALYQVLVLAGALIVAAQTAAPLLWRLLSRRRVSPTASQLAPALADGFDAFLPYGPEQPKSDSSDAVPHTGLVAFFVTMTVLLMIDCRMLPLWYN
ncbi:hypothetical protein [Mesorhizobium sp. B2-4-17]|uniref:hypothetical protein n=1 Tax=Mesorhizobium sp. B2-4-17 TaxID=2589932 RepID=UPI001129DE2A|nr:hypothetical protein [Mesorhizobium sp. B2-4-17]TPK87366.1 hypothetical protein FJ548_14305 [Mesorhizobium sp. B2-4-17]